MNRFALALAAFGLFSSLAPESADARPRGGRGGGVRIGGGGGVRFGGGVRYSAPPRVNSPGRAWSVGGGIRIGGTVSGGVRVGRPWYPRYYRPYYYGTAFYGPAYVPSYYGGYYGASYYPVAPAAPGVVAVAAAPRLELPKFALGVSAGAVSVEGVEESSDLGLLGRVRLGNGGLMVEGEIGSQSYADDLRVDRRLGASLIWEIGAENRFAPYLLAGLGVQQAEVAGAYESTQNFGELGVGIRYAITPRFHLAADVRAGNRQTISSDSPMTLEGSARLIAPPTSDSGEGEGYVRSRLSALFYF